MKSRKDDVATATQSDAIDGANRRDGGENGEIYVGFVFASGQR
ncbi:hypothetical protein [Fodinibius sp. AD559]